MLGFLWVTFCQVLCSEELFFCPVPTLPHSPHAFERKMSCFSFCVARSPVCASRLFFWFWTSGFTKHLVGKSQSIGNKWQPESKTSSTWSSQQAADDWQLKEQTKVTSSNPGCQHQEKPSRRSRGSQMKFPIELFLHGWLTSIPWQAFLYHGVNYSNLDWKSFTF